MARSGRTFVGIAPRVSGPIIRVAVHDNQEVKKGDLLFEIDPADFQARLNLAAGQVRNTEAIETATAKSRSANRSL
jgi:multidrug resistance efflux pump